MSKSNVANTYVNIEGLKEFKEQLLNYLSKKPLYEHKCINCGANVLLDENKPMFVCHYCGSTYAVGTNRMNDEG